MILREKTVYKNRDEALMRLGFVTKGRIGKVEEDCEPLYEGKPLFAGTRYVRSEGHTVHYKK